MKKKIEIARPLVQTNQLKNGLRRTRANRECELPLIALSLLISSLLGSICRAGTTLDETSSPTSIARNGSPIEDYFSHWFERVDKTQAEQPHWMTPLVTVTPRLEEEIRYDQFWQHTAINSSLDNFDGGKGIELI